MDDFLGTLLVIAFYGAPGLLPMVLAPLVWRRVRERSGPRILLAASMVLLGAVWMVWAAYFWLGTCWETWQPCEGTTQLKLINALLAASAAGVAAGLAWVAIGARFRRRAALGLGRPRDRSNRRP